MSTAVLRDRVAWSFFGAFALGAIVVLVAPPESTWDGKSGLTVVVITLAVAAVTGYFGVTAWREGNVWGDQGGAVWMAALSLFSGTLGIATTIGIVRAESTELTVVHTWGRATPERVQDRYVRFAERKDPVHLDSAVLATAGPGDRVRCRIVDPPLLRTNVVRCMHIDGTADR